MVKKTINKDIADSINKFIEEIKKQGYDKNYGARPLRRSIQTLVEDKIAEEILAGTLSVGKKQSYEFSKKQ